MLIITTIKARRVIIKEVRMLELVRPREGAKKWTTASMASKKVSLQAKATLKPAVKRIKVLICFLNSCLK